MPGTHCPFPRTLLGLPACPPLLGRLLPRPRQARCLCRSDLFPTEGRLWAEVPVPAGRGALGRHLSPCPSAWQVCWGQGRLQGPTADSSLLLLRFHEESTQHLECSREGSREERTLRAAAPLGWGFTGDSCRGRSGPSDGWLDSGDATPTVLASPQAVWVFPSCLPESLTRGSAAYLGIVSKLGGDQLLDLRGTTDHSWSREAPQPLLRRRSKRLGARAPPRAEVHARDLQARQMLSPRRSVSLPPPWAGMPGLRGGGHGQAG